MERVYRRGEKENTVIGIRADGNEVLGMGHLMRCLSIAMAFRELGTSVLFLTADDSGQELIQKKGFENLVLNTDYTRMETELEGLKEVIQERKISLLLIDSYQVTGVYLEAVRNWVKTVCLEEEIKEVRPADGIINYNIYASKLGYEEQYPKEIFRYLGSGYAPVRPEFAGKVTKICKQAKKILITMGGSDAYNISGQLLKAFLCRREHVFQEMEFEVVCGTFNANKEELLALAEQNARVHIRVQVEDMAGLMCGCDIAVAAAGSTMYELSALGVPTVCCYYVDNQKKIAEGFAQLANVINAGDFTKEPKDVTERILQAVKELASDEGLRRETAKSMRKVSDGRGAQRLALELLRDFGDDCKSYATVSKE